MASQQSELDLVQRVFDRIASASTDEQLQSEINKYLAPVIDKLNSGNAQVRNTIVEMFGHINRRIKDHHHIQLPVEDLLARFSTAGASSFVVNFSLIYIKMGYPRLDGNKQVELLPKLLESLEGKPQHHQDSILALLLPVLGLVKPSHLQSNSALLQLRDKPQIAKILLDYMQDILLLPYGSVPQSEQALLSLYEQRQQMREQRRQLARDIEEGRAERTAAAQLLADDSNESEHDSIPVPGVPAGMSICSFRRAVGDTPITPDNLEKLKMTVLKFLATEILTASSMALATIIASSDTRFSIANAAESLLRRLDASIEWNSSVVISAMYVLYLGTLTPIERTPTQKFKNPANTRIRLKLMPCFLKSREATNYAPLAVKVFCECLWGSYANSKLKQQGISFLHHVAFSASTEKLKPVGSMLFSGVVKVIDEEKNDPKLTSLAYGALAKLSLKLPSLLLSHHSQLHYLQTLMDALSHEVGDVLLAIQEALSMVAPVCKHLSPSSQEQLCIILAEHVLSDNPALRRNAVLYAASVFSRTHCASRFILLLASGDSQDDIRIEAMNELYKAVAEDAQGNAVHEAPQFFPMLQYILSRIDGQPRTKWRDIGSAPIPYSLKVMDELVIYLQHCLAVECRSNISSSSSSKHAIAVFKEGELRWPEPWAVREFVKNNYQHKDPKTGRLSFRQYLHLCEMVANAWSKEGIQALARMVAMGPPDMVKDYTARTDWIRKFLIRGTQAGETAAFLFGLVAAQVSELEQLERIIHSVNYNKDLRLESQHCCILAMGYSLAYSKRAMDESDDVLIEDDWQFYDESVKKLVFDLMNGDPSLQQSFVLAVSEVARRHPLPLPLGDLEAFKESKSLSDTSDDGGSKRGGGRQKVELTLVNLFRVLFPLIESSKVQTKSREQIIQCIGAVCAGETREDIKVIVLKRLLSYSNSSSDLDIHFAVGSALADCVPGIRSVDPHVLWFAEEKPSEDPAESNAQDDPKQVSPQSQDTVMEEKEEHEMMEKEQKKASTSEPAPTEESTEKMETDGGTEESGASTSAPVTDEEGSLSWLLAQLFDRGGTYSLSPNQRQAMCLWLLTIVQDYRGRQEVQDKLPVIQSSFESYLTHSNPVVQDAASKGLCLVYNICNADTRRSMVESLIHSLIEGKAKMSNVTADTKIFKEGELGSAPAGGGQLSTYKELCSLASDLNQPDLVYKFMNLANHNAVWNSRTAAAFGFGNLATQAGVELEKHLPDIIPKLYRYTHDPQPSIRNPMSNIWSSLVKDTKKTTEKHYDRILAELMNTLTNYEWRVRESSCAALTDLVRQHSIVPAMSRLDEIWTTLFRVADDFKESVRKAANVTLQTLSKSCVKLCESGSVEGQQVLELSIPVLLTVGIVSQVSEVRTLSLDTVVKVCRSGGAMIRPHLGTLVPALLEAIAGLEHQAFSLTSNRTTSDQDRERIDSVRVSVAKETPMMDALSYVLHYVDEQVIDQVVSGVVDVLKKSVGLTSRTTAAHVVERLAHTCPGPMEKHGGKLLTVLVNGLNDRNVTLRKVFANAIGTVIKVAKSSSIEKLLKKLQSWYLEKEDDSIRMSVGLTLRSMHRQSGDIMKNYGSHALPLAFLAMHAEKVPGAELSGCEVWEEVWQDNTPGTEAGVKLYLTEIMDLCSVAAQSNNWAMKAQTGKALATLSTKVGSSLAEEQTEIIAKLLVSSLQGRTWNGKENLTLALSTVAVKTKTTLSKLSPQNDDDGPLIDTIVKVLLREANKEKKEYKIHAMKALTLVLEEYQIDKFEDVFDICLPYVNQPEEPSTSSGDRDEDASVQQQEKELRWKLLEEMVQSLGRAWPVAAHRDTQERHSVRFIEILSSSISKVTRKVQLSIVETLSKYWARHYLVLEILTVGDATTTTLLQQAVVSSSSGTSSEGQHNKSSMPLYDPLLETQFDPAIQHSCKIFNYCLGISKYYSLKKQALTVLLEVVNRIKGNPIILSKLSRQMMQSVEEARRDSQPDIQHIAAEIQVILRSSSS